MSSLVVVGDALLDRDIQGRVERMCPEAPAPVLDEEEGISRSRGAGLAATLAARDGHEVTLVTALAGDSAAQELRALLRASGVRVIDLGLAGRTPTKIRLKSDGTLLLRLDREARARRVGPATEAVRGALATTEGVLVSDYGRGVVATRGVRGLLVAPLVWDPHSRGSEPVQWARLACPNRSEAQHFSGLADPSAAARELRRSWAACAVAVTIGAMP